MANLSDLLGTFMQNAMSPSGGQRIGSVFKDLQGTIGNRLDRPDGTGGGILNRVLDAAKDTIGNAANNPIQAAGLGAVLGSLVGGGGKSISGAIQGGALAILAGVAYKALSNAGQGAADGSTPTFSGGAVPIGMTTPPTPADQQVLTTTAELIIRGMINAAKADGKVGAEEIVRIVGRLKEAGMGGDTEAWMMKELRQPLDLDAFAAAIPNQEVAAQVYAASLLAIEVDTPQERTYLSELARNTGLDASVVQSIQQTLGVQF